MFLTSCADEQLWSAALDFREAIPDRVYPGLRAS